MKYTGLIRAVGLGSLLNAWTFGFSLVISAGRCRISLSLTQFSYLAFYRNQLTGDLWDMIMQHMRAPHTSKHTWTGLVPKLVWGFFVGVAILELGLFCCLGFFVALLLFICFTFLI